MAISNGFTIICLGLWAPEAFEVNRNQLVGHGDNVMGHGNNVDGKLGPHGHAGNAGVV